MPHKSLFDHPRCLLVPSIMPGVDQQFLRTATTEEDGGDHIGYETPRSGVATPQPDLQDKRLPGIMSYFGQVRPDPLPPTEMSEMPSTSACSALQPPPGAATPPRDDLRRRSVSSADRHSQLPANSIPSRSGSASGDPADPAAATSTTARRAAPPGRQSNCSPQKRQSSSHPYPTPPTSLPSSSGGTPVDERQSPDWALRPFTGAAASGASIAMPRPSSSYTKTAREAPEKSSQGTLLASQPSAQSSSQSSTSGLPPDSAADQNQNTSQTSRRWYTLGGLKELTRGVIFKSGSSTPTRALSAAQPSQAEIKSSVSSASNDGAERSGTQTPRASSSSTGVQAPAPKGKLTIKIPEGRGLRKSRDPYVVVVFQRSELISGGARSIEEDDNLSVTPVAAGGIPIQRQGSDSGRPPMSIPMRSRQSSNTSVTDHSSIRTRSARTSSVNPKWDAEAVL